MKVTQEHIAHATVASLVGILWFILSIWCHLYALLEVGLDARLILSLLVHHCVCLAYIDYATEEIKCLKMNLPLQFPPKT